MIYLLRHDKFTKILYRYFLASFIQAQIFYGLCQVTVYGDIRLDRPLPMPLHRCDIYGSKRAGKLLK